MKGRNKWTKGVLLTLAILSLLIIPAAPAMVSPGTIGDLYPSPQEIIDVYDICDTFTLNVTIENATDLYNFDFSARWDPNILECNTSGPHGGFANGSFLTVEGAKLAGYKTTTYMPGSGVDNTAGTIGVPGMEGWSLFGPLGGIYATGPGTLMQIDFHVKDYAEAPGTNITITLLLYDTFPTTETHVFNATFVLTPPPPPPATRGVVDFTQYPDRSPGQLPGTYFNDTEVEFDPRTVSQAYNNFTDTWGSATKWNWTIAHESTYSISLNLCEEGVAKSAPGIEWNGSHLIYTFTMIGQWTIQLWGYFDCMNETTILAAGIDLIWSNPVTHIKTVILPPVGALLELYTETERWCGYVTPYIGEGPNQPADAYTLDEEVTLFVNLTYNEGPLQDRLIAFEVIDPSNYIVLVRTVWTDENGTATISFRIITLCGNATYAFGKWFVIAKTKVCEVPVNDTLMFDVGWIVEIEEIVEIGVWDPTGGPYGIGWYIDPALYVPGSLMYGATLGPTWDGIAPVSIPTDEFKPGDGLVVWFRVKNIAMIPHKVTISVVGYDHNGVPFYNVIIHDGWILPGEFCNPYEMDFWWFIYVMKWAYCGTATLYINAFTDLPTECGVPYCPEISRQFRIVWN